MFRRNFRILVKFIGDTSFSNTRLVDNVVTDVQLL